VFERAQGDPRRGLVSAAAPRAETWWSVISIHRQTLRISSDCVANQGNAESFQLLRLRCTTKRACISTDLSVLVFGLLTNSLNVSKDIFIFFLNFGGIEVFCTFHSTLEVQHQERKSESIQPQRRKCKSAHNNDSFPREKGWGQKELWVEGGGGCNLLSYACSLYIRVGTSLARVNVVYKQISHLDSFYKASRRPVILFLGRFQDVHLEYNGQTTLPGSGGRMWCYLGLIATMACFVDRTRMRIILRTYSGYSRQRSTESPMMAVARSEASHVRKLLTRIPKLFGMK